MSLTGGTPPAISQSIGRVTTPHAPGSDAIRSGKRGDNIDGVAPSRVADATNQARWRQSLYGTTDGINGGLASAAAFQNGLYPSLSLPPSGVNGSGAIAQAQGGPGAQQTSSANQQGITPAQMQALNQSNKIPPELLAKMLAEKTNKTQARQDPKQLEKGRPTTDPKLNDALEKLGKSLSAKIKEFDMSLQEALNDKTDEKFKDEFKDSGFDTKKDLFDFNAQMQKNVDIGKFDKDTYDQFSQFLDSVPDKEEYKDLKAEGLEIKDAYKKGLDETENNTVTGNFITAKDEITEGEGNEGAKSFLESFKEQAPKQVNPDGSPKLDDDGQPMLTEKAQEFYDLAEKTINDTNDKFIDTKTGASEMEEHLQTGEFNGNITKLKDLYVGTKDKPGLRDQMKLVEGETNSAEKIMDNMMFMKYSSPYSADAKEQNEGLQEILASKNSGEKVTVKDLMDNDKTKNNIGKYYTEELNLESTGDIQNYIIPNELDGGDNANPPIEYGQASVSPRSEMNSDKAISDLGDAVAFNYDLDLDEVEDIDVPNLDFEEIA